MAMVSMCKIQAHLVSQESTNRLQVKYNSNNSLDTNLTINTNKCSSSNGLSHKHLAKLIANIKMKEM